MNTRKALLVGGPLDGQVRVVQSPAYFPGVLVRPIGGGPGDVAPYERVGEFLDGTMILRYGPDIALARTQACAVHS